MIKNLKRMIITCICTGMIISLTGCRKTQSDLIDGVPVDGEITLRTFKSSLQKCSVENLSDDFENVVDEETQEIFNEELEDDDAVIDGNGSFNDPYVIDEDEAPVFSEYLEEVGEALIEDMGSEETEGVVQTGTYDKILSGESCTNCKYGATWKFSDSSTKIKNALKYNG